MASNKKWIIGGSITLLVLLGLSIGTGAIIGAINKPEFNRITIHLGDQEFKQKIDLGTDSTSDEDKAKMLEQQFYSAALYGTFKGINADAESSSFILDTENEGSLDWNLPYIVTDTEKSKELQNLFVEVKFLSETEQSSVFTFLNGMLGTTDNEVELLSTISQLIEDSKTAGMPFPSVTGLDVISKDEFNETESMIYDLLSNDLSYTKSIQKDILVYTYLWQNAPQNAYDNIFTRELVYSSPSMVYKMTLDGEAADADSTIYSEIKDATEHGVDKATWNNWVDTSATEGVLVDDTIVDDYLTVGGTESMFGYQGIKFGTSAGTSIASDWTKWENTWVPDDTVAKGEASTSSGEYTHQNILEQSNLYLASEQGADGEGAAIFDTSSDSTNPEFGSRDGERSVYAYTQLYPFLFRNVEDSSSTDEEDVFGNEYFSLFANGDETAGYTPAEDEDSATSYLFNEWFGDDEKTSAQGEIYVSEAIVKNNSLLTSKALRYWNNQGFWIELTGSYEDDLASYLPEEILFDE